MNILQKIKIFLKSKFNKNKLLPDPIFNQEDVSNTESWRKRQEINIASLKYEITEESEAPGKNRTYEETLMTLLKNKNKYIIEEEKNQENGQISFYHVLSQKYNDEKNKNDKIELNLDIYRSHVSELVYEIIKEAKEEEFNLKFASDQLLEKESIIEKIVCYTNEDNIDKTINILRKIKNERSDLFEGSKNINLFIEQSEEKLEEKQNVR